MDYHTYREYRNRKKYRRTSHDVVIESFFYNILSILTDDELDRYEAEECVICYTLSYDKLLTMCCKHIFCIECFEKCHRPIKCYCGIENPSFLKIIP